MYDDLAVCTVLSRQQSSTIRQLTFALHLNQTPAYLHVLPAEQSIASSPGPTQLFNVSRCNIEKLGRAGHGDKASRVRVQLDNWMMMTTMILLRMLYA